MKVCFYSAVSSKNLFTTVGFYRDDIIALGMRGDAVTATNSLWALVQLRPKLVVGYFYSKSALAALLGRLVGAKIILTGGADQISPVLHSGFSLLIRQVSAVACVLLSNRILLSCADDFENFRSLCFGCKRFERKLELVAHAVVVPPLSSESRLPINGRFEALTLCWMGSESNVWRKGLDRAIDLIAALRKLGVRASLDIAGADGPGVQLVMDLAKKSGVENEIRYLGMISEAEKNEKFASASVYIQLSRHEGFGVAAAEAFFSGMIFVHSDKGGLHDVIGSDALILDPEAFKKGGSDWVQDFYDRYLLYKVDKNVLLVGLQKYSLETRSAAFLRKS